MNPSIIQECWNPWTYSRSSPKVHYLVNGYLVSVSLFFHIFVVAVGLFFNIILRLSSLSFSFPFYFSAGQKSSLGPTFISYLYFCMVIAGLSFSFHFLYVPAMDSYIFISWYFPVPTFLYLFLFIFEKLEDKESGLEKVYK